MTLINLMQDRVNHTDSFNILRWNAQERENFSLSEFIAASWS